MLTFRDTSSYTETERLEKLSTCKNAWCVVVVLIYINDVEMFYLLFI